MKMSTIWRAVSLAPFASLPATGLILLGNSVQGHRKVGTRVSRPAPPSAACGSPRAVKVADVLDWIEFPSAVQITQLGRTVGDKATKTVARSMKGLPREVCIWFGGVSLTFHRCTAGYHVSIPGMTRHTGHDHSMAQPRKGDREQIKVRAAAVVCTRLREIAAEHGTSVSQLSADLLAMAVGHPETVRELDKATLPQAI